MIAQGLRFLFLKKRSFLLLMLVFLFTFSSYSQFYETGQDPFSVKWRQIKTRNFKLIFPAEFEEKAQLFATALDTIYPVSSKFLLSKPKPVSVIFHTQSSLSNGMVVYAPKRMELYTIPPQDNYPQDWLDQLALHETRHVAQLDALNHGLTKLGSILIGQQAVGAVSGLVPRWFLEGDAVYAETMFSRSGRGRSASFLMPYRALVLSKPKLYPYEKALLGSYRDYIPDIYQMGYPMVKALRDSFDSDIYGKALKFTAGNPYLVFPFGHSLKKNSGYNNRYTYEYTYNSLRKKWNEQDTIKPYEHFPVQDENAFPNYNFPITINASEVVAQKWSLSQLRRIVVTDKRGNEKKVIATGSNSGERLSVYGSKITWSENRNDIRWQNRTYSEIRVFDMSKNKLTRLTKKTWYFSPAFSNDGKFISVVEETPGYESYLVILDATSGKVMRKIVAPEGNHLQHPLWSGKNEIYCLMVSKNGKSIVKLNQSHSWEEVVPSSTQNISSFCFADSVLILASETNGLNNLFGFNPQTGIYHQITNSRFGAFQPFYNANTKQIYFSDYTSNGYRIASVSWPARTYNTFSSLNPEDTNMNADFNIQNQSKENRNLPVNSYSKWNLFNIHSWLPAYFNYSVSDVTNPDIYPGAILLSQNLLGTMISSFGYSYQDGHSHFHTNLTYKALYPVITWSINAGGPIRRVGGNSSIPVNYSNNINSNVNVSLPLNLSHRNKSSAFVPYVEWRYNRNAYYVKSENRYFQELNQVNWGLNYYYYTRMATRDIFPKAGISSFFKMQSTPFEDDIFNSIYALSLRAYLPGLFKHHSFQVRYGFQQQNPLRYYFASILPFPSGYHSRVSEKLHLLNINYALPLFYPDLHAGPFFYIKRFRTNVFFDIADNTSHGNNGIISEEILRSLGTDIIADVHFLRIMFPFQVGARFSYLPDEKTLFTQAIFSVNLVY